MFFWTCLRRKNPRSSRRCARCQTRSPEPQHPCGKLVTPGDNLAGDRDVTLIVKDAETERWVPYLRAARGPAKLDPRTDRGGPVPQAEEPPAERQQPPHVLELAPG